MRDLSVTFIVNIIMYIIVIIEIMSKFINTNITVACVRSLGRCSSKGRELVHVSPAYLRFCQTCIRLCHVGLSVPRNHGV